MLTASRNAQKLLLEIAPKGQPENMRNYLPGYENYMDMMMETSEAQMAWVMQTLSEKLKRTEIIHDGLYSISEHPGKMNRTILAIDQKLGGEILIGFWGQGFNVPVHGHDVGFIFDTMLHGKMKTNVYKLMGDGKARLQSTKIITEGFEYFDFVQKGGHEYSNFVHSFTALEPSASLHFQAKHTHDGMANAITPEYFDNVVLYTKKDIRAISIQKALKLKKGSVLLVDSKSPMGKNLGLHYLVVTGNRIGKTLDMEGIVIDAVDNAIISGKESGYFNIYQLEDMLAKEFISFHELM